MQRFLVTRVCSVCHGTRLRPEALASQLGGRNLAEISALTLDELRGFAAGLPAGLPAELSRMTAGLLAELDGRLTPLLDVGLGYLTLERGEPDGSCRRISPVQNASPHSKGRTIIPRRSNNASSSNSPIRRRAGP